MAQLLPEEPWSTTKSPAEYFIFERIQAELDDSWSALHSVGLTEHRSKPWAEIDFVLVGPLGVFCLEVKGGTVRREKGVWYSQSQDGVDHNLGKGPFDQVGSAQSAFRVALVERAPWFSDHLIGYGVVTPDCRFDVPGPDVQTAIVYDDRDVLRPFDVYLERLYHYWSRRYGGRRGLSPSEASRVVDVIRGDFHLAASLQATIAGIETTLIRLTREQAERLEDMAENQAVIVTGGAGTGKTVLALEEARREAAGGKRTLLCCFSKVLAAHLRRTLGATANVDVFHLHGLTTALIREAGYQDRLSRAEDPGHFEVDHPEVASEALSVLDRHGFYGALILDEGQDLLTMPYLHLLDELFIGGFETGRWRMFFDANQNIFGGVATPAVRLLHSCAPARLRLRRNCRNTKPIAIMNAIVSGIPLSETLIVEGPHPQRLSYQSKGEQAPLIADHLNGLLGQGLDPGEIVVLTPRQRSNSVLAKPLPGGPPVVDYDEFLGTKDIRHSTIRGFKGMDATAVVVADIEDLASAKSRAELYIACSRARAILTLVCAEATTADYNAGAIRFGTQLADQLRKSAISDAGAKAIAAS